MKTFSIIFARMVVRNVATRVWGSVRAVEYLASLTDEQICRVCLALIRAGVA